MIIDCIEMLQKGKATEQFGGFCYTGKIDCLIRELLLQV